VRQFWEKPTPALAVELLARGCFWNTFVTVGRARAFLDRFCTQVPSTILQIFTGLADEDISAAYELVQPIDSSREVLIQHPRSVAGGVRSGLWWLDLGSPARLLDAMARHGIEPRWLSDIEAATGRIVDRCFLPESW